MVIKVHLEISECMAYKLVCINLEVCYRVLHHAGKKGTYW